jgi:hypothetical protein
MNGEALGEGEKERERRIERKKEKGLTEQDRSRDTATEKRLDERREIQRNRGMG